MNFVNAMKRTLLAGALVSSLLTPPLLVYAEATGSRSGGGDIIVFDIVDAVVVKPASAAAPVADDVIVDGRIITAEDWTTASAAPTGTNAFNGRLLTAADLRAEQ